MTTRLTKEQAEAYSKIMSEASARFVASAIQESMMFDLVIVRTTWKHFQGMKNAPFFRKFRLKPNKDFIVNRFDMIICSYNLD